MSVAKVDMDVGYWSQEERASMGVMLASTGKLVAALPRRTCRIMSVLSYAALEWVIIALLLNQWPARLRHRQVRGLLRAQLTRARELCQARARRVSEARICTGVSTTSGAVAVLGASAGATSGRTPPSGCPGA
jgi:predicted DNA repair protein MutK